MFNSDNLTAIEAQKQANWICFAPMIFQSIKTMINLGIMDVLRDSGDQGSTLENISKKTNVSKYGTRVLLHSALGAGVVFLKEDKYILTKTGYFLINKQIPSEININFVHDVCYKGLYYLEDSIRNGQPEGLRTLGNWDTIYDGLSELPENIRKSWLDLDHYFSDISYEKAYKELEKEEFTTLLDLGGNTGKFTRFLLQKKNNLQVTIADLPGQITMAKETFEQYEATDRVHFQSLNILDKDKHIQGNFEMIWMSQFLDCFHDDDILNILLKCKTALTQKGCIYVQEAFWDRQRFETSAFSLQQFSLYFTALANGRSQMYDFATFEEIVDKAHLKITKIVDHIGISNSLLKIEVK